MLALSKKGFLTRVFPINKRHYLSLLIIRDFFTLATNHLYILTTSNCWNVTSFRSALEVLANEVVENIIDGQSVGVGHIILWLIFLSARQFNYVLNSLQFCCWHEMALLSLRQQCYYYVSLAIVCAQA